MQELRRVKVGNFNIDTSITIEVLEKNRENVKYIESKLIKIEDVFQKNEKITLNSKKIALFLNGVKLSIEKQDGIYKIYNENGIFIGTGELSDGKLKRDVVI